MHAPTSSLTDPPAGNSIADAVAWAQGVALGTVATAVAVTAVAAIGLLMLSGRLELRRGITAVFGCFILFGAAEIAARLTNIGNNGTRANQIPVSDSNPLAQQVRASPPSEPAAYDPYAGASVPAARQK